MTRRTLILICIALGSPSIATSQDTFRINVLGYQWTTSHRTITFSWAGSASTSCNGSSNTTGYVSNAGTFSANGNSSATCSTTYTPPGNQNIEVLKPVVFILADSDTSRMILSCTRNVRWSQCHALNPGVFVARNDKGHFEVQGVLAKGKEEWVKYEVVQQTALLKPPVVVKDAAPSIANPNSSSGQDDNEGFAQRWKSMKTGTTRTLRFGGDHIYGEVILPDEISKRGMFSLMDVKKEGDKYVGQVNSRYVSSDGKQCVFSNAVELTVISKDRIEGRGQFPPPNSKISDWNSCVFSAPDQWQDFAWIPVR